MPRGSEPGPGLLGRGLFLFALVVTAQRSGRCHQPQSSAREARSNATDPPSTVGFDAGSCISIRHRYILCRLFGLRSPKTAHAAAGRSFHPPFWMRPSQNMDSKQLVDSLTLRLLTRTRVLGRYAGQPSPRAPTPSLPAWPRTWPRPPWPAALGRRPPRRSGGPPRSRSGPAPRPPAAAPDSPSGRC